MNSTVNGAKYITAHTIGSRIARNNKTIEFDIYDIVEWCAEAEINIGDFEGFQRYNNVSITVKDKKALLPCNVYRLLQVKGAGSAVYNYENNGTYLIFQDNSSQGSSSAGANPPNTGELQLFIDYLGIPIDPDTNFPLIKDGHQEACYWYCMTKLMLEDYLNRKIDEGRWAFIQGQYGKYVQKAKSGFQYVSRDDMDKMAMIVTNMIPRIRMPRHGMK